MAGVAGAPAHGPGDTAAHARRPFFNPAHVLTLLWVRGKLTLRGYARGGVARIIGLVLLLLFLLPVVGGLGVLSYVGYTNLPRATAVQLLFVVLTVLYAIWAALPLLQYTLNEGLDVTKLQIYPVTLAEQMAALVLATFMDVGTLALIGFYVPIAFGWHATPTALAITLAALALAYVHTIALSQLLIAALMGLLRSRRFRDVSIIIFALLGASFSVLGQLVNPILRASNPRALANIQVDRYLQYTPPGMAARAIALADAGSYALAGTWLLVLAGLALVVLALWGWILRRSVTSPESAGGTSRRARRRAENAAAIAAAARSHVPGVNGATAVEAHAARRRRLLSGPVLAIAGKDARYLWRDPQLKASLLSSLFVLVFVVFIDSGGSFARGGFHLQPNTVLFAPIPTLIVALNLSLNALGLERQGLQMLFLFPVRPLDVFVGKNLTVGTVTFSAQVVLALILAAVSGGWVYVPMALAAGLAAILVLMACGNVSSVLLPFRVREMRAGQNSTSSENGFLRAVLSSVVLGLTAVLLAPVVLALLIPLVLAEPTWLVGTLPAAVAYGVAFHQIVTRLIAPRLLARAPEILAATVRE
jgi:ABC-2 type transport system permease protein